MGAVAQKPQQGPLPVSQNHRIVGVGRDLCGSPSPTLAMLNISQHKPPTQQNSTASGLEAGGKCHEEDKPRQGDNQPMKMAGVKQYREGTDPTKKMFFPEEKFPQTFSLLGEISPNEKTALKSIFQ